jgi:hypothetical protein
VVQQRWDGELDETTRRAVLLRAEKLLRPSLFRDGASYVDYRRRRVVEPRAD